MSAVLIKESAASFTASSGMALLCFVRLSYFCPCVCQGCSGAGWLAASGSSGEEHFWEGRHPHFFVFSVFLRMSL